MKVAVIKSNTFLDEKLKRVFELNNIKVDIVEKFNIQSTKSYQVVLFSSKNKINKINLVMESIVNTKSCLVVYINNTVNIGRFHNLLTSSFFLNVEELKIDTILYEMVIKSSSYLREIQYLNYEIEVLNDKLKEEKNINKAKYLLIDKGFSEADSHKLIQKTAMNYRLSKSEAASLIIKNKIDI